MATFTIKSRKLNRTFSFFMNANGGYIYLQSKGRPGTLGQQIFKNAGINGSTIAADTEEQFVKACRKWYRQYMKKEAASM